MLDPSLAVQTKEIVFTQGETHTVDILGFTTDWCNIQWFNVTHSLSSNVQFPSAACPGQEFCSKLDLSQLVNESGTITISAAGVNGIFEQILNFDLIDSNLLAVPVVVQEVVAEETTTVGL